jgi:endonuclease YncB( thermonuclease family)
MFTKIFKLALCIMLLSVPSLAQYVGTVSSVVDGQTITVSTAGGSPLTVRLNSIEVPDDGQPLSDTVTEHLSTLAFGKTVGLRIVAISYEFVVADVTINGIDLSQQMLRDGAAWYVSNASSTVDEASDVANEQTAKREKRGIWAIDGLKRPSQIRQEVTDSKDPLHDKRVSQLAWEQLGQSTEGVFPSESFTPATGDCSGVVTNVVDGDTVHIRTSGGREVIVRLAGMDAPEKSQAFGMAAKQHLTSLIAGQAVSCRSTKKDRYGRLVGKISLNGQDINFAMVQAGFAWQYKEYASEMSPQDRLSYSDAEHSARLARLGLWSDDNPIYPSDYRRGYFLARYYEPYTSTSPDLQYGSGSYSSGGTKGGPVYVHSYSRSNGTSVGPYTRSGPTRH